MDEVLSALRKMHNFERFAKEIYGTQIRAFSEQEIADRLTTARDNEQEHANSLRIRIEELGGSTSCMGFFFQMAGRILGFSTTMLGKMRLFKIDVWIEKRAVRDYGDFLQKVDFDEKSRSLIEKNIEDEKVHIKTWEESIEMLKRKVPVGEL